MALSSGPCIGECIYCGARRYSSERVKLGREHVVPRGLGGQWTVLEASCKKCEGIINNEAENICQSRIMLGPLRYRLGLKPSGLTHLPINISYDGYYSYETQIPIEKAPILLFLPVLAEPGLLRTIFHFSSAHLRVVSRTGPQPERNPFIIPTEPEDPDMPAVFIRAEHDKVLALAAETGAQTVSPFGVTVRAEPLLRMVAKIAHSFAVYQMGGVLFKPFLQNLILGEKSSRPISHYVGGDPAVDMHYPLIENERHSLELVFGLPEIYKDRLLLVNIHLFRDIGFPSFRAVVGRYRKEHTPKPRG